MLVVTAGYGQSIVGKWYEDGQEGTITFTEDKRIILDMPQQAVMPPTVQLTYVVNYEVTPMAYDMIISDGQFTQTALGIIEFVDETTLRMYMPANSGQRPTSFPDKKKPEYKKISILKRL